MSTDPTAPSNDSATDPMTDAGAALLEGANATASKGKEKAPLHEEEDEEESSDEEEEAEDDEGMEEDGFEEIDPSAILAPGARRTRGAAVNYASAEALEKAGLKPEDLEEEHEESYVADEKMEDD